MSKRLFIVVSWVLSAACVSEPHPDVFGDESLHFQDLVYEVDTERKGTLAAGVFSEGSQVGTVELVDGTATVQIFDSFLHAALVDGALDLNLQDATGNEWSSTPVPSLDGLMHAERELREFVEGEAEASASRSRSRRLAQAVSILGRSALALAAAREVDPAAKEVVAFVTARAALELGFDEGALHVVPPPDEVQEDADAPRCDNGCTRGSPEYGYCSACCDEDQYPACGWDWWGPYCFCEPLNDCGNQFCPETTG
jgi:hypothetical protein